MKTIILTDKIENDGEVECAFVRPAASLKAAMEAAKAELEPSWKLVKADENIVLVEHVKFQSAWNIVEDGKVIFQIVFTEIEIIE